MNNFRFSFANLIIFAAVFAVNIFAQNNFPDVTLYKDSKYSGEFLFVKPGNIRFTGKFDFNDLTSSIEVPKGFVAVIYEHSDNKGGYGRSVDLMENCEDLSKFDLNDKISYISVFS